MTIEGTDKRAYGKVMQLIESAATGTLKNTTYLERRTTASESSSKNMCRPVRDGFGARFIFLRRSNEKPFLTPSSPTCALLPRSVLTIKLNMRFKLADMMMDGKLSINYCQLPIANLCWLAKSAIGNWQSAIPHEILYTTQDVLVR